MRTFIGVLIGASITAITAVVLDAITTSRIFR